MAKNGNKTGDICFGFTTDSMNLRFAGRWRLRTGVTRSCSLIPPKPWHFTRLIHQRLAVSMTPVWIVLAFVLCTSGALAQTARDFVGPAGVVPLASEQSQAKIIIDPPLADPLAHGRVVIQYRAENLRIVQVFGPATLNVSPRIGHIHVTVDNAVWRWADASGEALIINGLPAGPHEVLIELVNANHQTLDRGVVHFVIPSIM